MRRPLRYLLALCIASGVTVGIAIEHDSILLLFGTFVTYTMTVALWLRYPSLLRLNGTRGDGFNIATGVVAGGTSFGVLTLSQGVGETLHLGAGVLGFGLIWFGVICGIWMVDNGEITLQSSGTERPNSDAADPHNRTE